MEQNWYAGKMPGEISYEEIQRKAENGEFREWNYQSTTGIEYGYEDLKSKLESYTAVEYLGYQEKRDAAKKACNTAEAEKWQGEMDRMINEVYDIYRSRNVYPTAYFSEIAIMDEISKCCAYKAFWTGDTVSCGAGVGTTLCKFLFPNLQDTPSKHDLDKEGAESIFAKFHNEKYLKRAIQFCFSYKNGCPVPTAVEGGLRLVGSAPSNFRPMNAKAIYERFAPAGGVIFDPCCVDRKTEFFNGYEWKPISDYVQGDRVLQYNADGSAELVAPLDYIHYKSDAPFYLFKGKNFNSCLTGNHNIVYRKRVNQSSSLSEEVFFVKQEDIIGRDFRGRIPLTCEFNGLVHVNESLLRLAVAVQADGTVDNFNTGRVRFGVTKQNKVDRLEYLLSSANIQYRKVPWVSASKKSSWYFYFNCKDVTDFFAGDFSKTFPSEWYGLDEVSKKAFLEEVFLWDGSSYLPNNGRKSAVQAYYSSNKSNADLVWFLLNTAGGCGAGAVYCDNRYQNVTYVVTKRTISGYSSYERRGSCDFEEVYEEDKYCFTVPSHMLVLRREGQMFVTGNCGFGGRLLGCLSSNKNFKYIGCDPNTETMYHLHQLADYIEMVTGRENSYELHCCGSEDMRGPANSVDFAFTSPPYFDLEIYSNEPTQCYNKFPELKQWLEGYVRATIKNIVYMLKPGRVYAINIADFSCGSETVHYVDEWARISAEEGAPLFDTVYLGVTARAGSKEQAAGELKKENILIFKKRA